MERIRLGAAVAVLGLVLTGAAGLGSAHETTTVNGYEFTFGGADEPVITGERMWLQVEILDVETGEPVEGIGEAIAMAVQRPFGNDTFDLEVGAVHGQAGLYQGAVVFTEPGTYTIFVTAEIDGATIDTEFQKQVHNASHLQYPQPTPSTGDDAGMSAPMGFGLGVAAAAVGLVAGFVVGRRTQ